MRIKHLHVKNFMSIGNIEIDLDKQGLNLVLGKNCDDKRFDSNGSAKSALFEAMTWGLYGQLLRPLTQEEIIRNGTTKVEVNVLVDPEDGTESVWFKRSRFKAKGHFINVETISGKPLFPANSVKDIQEQIDSWLGLDFRTFTNSVYFGKGLVKFFMSSSDNDRKELLETILQLVSFDKALESAKEDVKNITADIQNIENSIVVSTAMNDMNQLNFSLYEKSLNMVLKQKEEELPEIEKLLTAHNDSKIQMLGVIHDLTEEINILNKEYKDKLLELDTSLKQEKLLVMARYENEVIILKKKKEADKKDIMSKYDEETKKAIEERDHISQKRTYYLETQMKALSELAGIKKEKDKVNTQIEKVNLLGAECITCGQIVSNTYKDKMLADLANDLENWKFTEEEQKGTLSDLKFDIEYMSNELVKANSIIENIQKECSTVLDDLDREYLEQRDKIKEAEMAELDARMVEVAKIKIIHEQEHTTKTEDKWKTHSKITEDIGKHNLAIQQGEASKTAIEISLESCTKNIQTLSDTIKTIENTIKEQETKKKTLLKQKDLSEFWVEGFGSKGIKSFIFEAALPYLTERANAYSSYLTGGTVVIDILPTTMVKSTGSSKEKLFIQAKNKIGANVYNGNSDGERRRIDVCVLLALQDLIATRATKKWNTVIFDEVMDALDKTGTEYLIDLFRTFSGKSIYIISHSSDLKSHFDTSIIIKKEKGISNIL